ncbi:MULTISPECIES: carbon-nitrogen hydrolase family protein [unclassified Dehalobacter]|uniref:carbon-nitrogen hydrolase family protein n=1 Tax=unclassified Dehalobacter TaxID=2635733 RepID=UPI000E6D11F7|nr:MULTISPECIES: carbon-nitrogen hydrolase family protein [unclassified Dehalobacter]RJE48600.1 carbon-nitrogen hydrolase [Dehalobacter sp. MCB1]TCX46740.1 carbon-nitrogen hydrolase [Dehalobacter sp. 14DCB1]TCX51229.1 carbon-nitrogen hydrolase [Dehalobacter sp. 12DCB1]
MSIVRAAALQLKVSPDKTENVDRLQQHLASLAKENVDLVILPEMFNCPYQTSLFPDYAEEEGGACWQKLSSLAAQYKMYLVAGSMPEKDRENKIYNTSYVFDRQGRQIGKHRKVHLFDIDIEGGQQFRESDTLSPGNKATVFDTEFGTMGLCICYDLRFPELARLMADQGAKMIIVPGAFNMTTGPAHWEILFRTRAVDNQVFTVGAAPARDAEAGYMSWGHTLMVGPWGNVLQQMDEREGCIIQDLDLAEVAKVRRELPLLAQRRSDLYQLTSK